MATNPQRRLALTLSAIGALAIIAIVAAILINLSNRPSPSASTGSSSAGHKHDGDAHHSTPVTGDIAGHGGAS
ncbi:hypothetical protein [Haematomicrobium sanguinis]|uniref:hypothetical protein n=1 Tax=Haematomicrobium sanguinis TaxID=479106 RepID=UPI00047C40E7|nr:hypothetical protein [Haematomicrobium sanguinis]